MMLKRNLIFLFLLVTFQANAQGFVSGSSAGGGVSQAAVDAAIEAYAATVVHRHSVSLPFTNAPSPAYLGSFYDLASSPNDFNPSSTFGVALVGAAAHFMVVAAAGDIDIELTVTGTSITDAMVRTPGDSEVLYLTDGAAGTYYETGKKWLGEVTIEKTSGLADRLVNYGWCKYWDNGNKDFILVGGEGTWMGDRTAIIDFAIYHHKTTGWTYNAGGKPDPPTPLLTMSDVHGAESQTRSDVVAAFKVAGLSQLIRGSLSEGLIIAFFFDVGGCIEYGQLTTDYTQPYMP